MVKRPYYYSWRGHRFTSEYVSGGPTPSSGLCGCHTLVWCTDIHAGIKEMRSDQQVISAPSLARTRFFFGVTVIALPTSPVWFTAGTLSAVLSGRL